MRRRQHSVADAGGPRGAGSYATALGASVERGSECLLRVEGLQVLQVRAGRPPTSLVRNISFEVHREEIVCMVGESGSGKSLSAQAVMGLLEDEPHLRVRGRIEFGGRDLFELSSEDRRELRGSEMTMVFQEPMSSLDPVMRVGVQVGEAIHRVERLSRVATRSRTLELFRQVGLPDVERVWRSYPHELSGGMCQRVMIAMALAPRPQLLIADEPTTALDVTVQAQILDLLLRLREQEGMSILLITHDMAVAAAVADHVVVVYAGRTVEDRATSGLFADPWHPYTIGLLRSLPRLNEAQGKEKRLHAIPGAVPNPGSLPEGCAFGPRCELIVPRCHREDPPLMERSGQGCVACWVATADD